ncbi:futalosine hydrolase [Symbioplanes lichenis]|uniref:futalosine hydrolase n=1 Tax=Symbioplanes lichenis TaxID=1629072 RepID=UPI0027392FB2|nr:futalosine hydrolase [Actinoplanes lichenis]
MRRLLIVTAVEPEAAAVRAGLPATSRASDPSPHATLTATSEANGPGTHAPPPAAPEREPERTGAHTQAGPTVAPALASPAAPVIVHVEPVGVGPAAAAAGTARLLALAEARGLPYDAVICAGIAGGFAERAPVGATILGARSIAADLGAEAGDPTPGGPGFLSIEELGFGSSVVAADGALLAALSAALPHAVVGDVLTLATVTGTAATADALRARFPGAVAEAMEGHGVAVAAQGAGVAFVELRTVSNPVGPRDRAAWRLREAFSALTDAVAKACG